MQFADLEKYFYLPYSFGILQKWVAIPMTIKRRLFISNILMIILPIILTAVMFFALYFIFVGVSGINPLSVRQGLSIVDPYRGGIVLRSENYTPIASDISVYQADTGGYIVVLPDDLSVLVAYNQMPYSVPAMMFLFLLLIVFLTNRALTKLISGRIMTSIETLVNGVREISDGNLAYRINYNSGDEFDAVCADFNEMAFRLSDMVRQRQIDESNRKELIAGISHDLKTPLTSIKGHVEGLRKGIASTPEMREKYLGIIQSKAEDMEYIISQLFLFSKMDIGEFPFNLEVVDIGDELDEMIAVFADEYRERGLAISLEEKTQGVFVSIDTVQFRNVVQNILDNSAKYGGKENARAEIYCRGNENSVSITIKDNGPGVSEEMLKKMFEVFYRSDISRNNPGKGSGLGLAISSKIAERLNGSITAENARGGGLSVIITLPRQKGGQ